MRFCQVDGTPLVDDAPAFDPYATIVAPAIPVAEPPVEEPVAEAATAEPEAPVVEEPAVEEPVIHQTIGSMPIAPPEEILDLPSSDPLKTMYVSDAEMQAALGTPAEESEPDVMELPPIEEAPAPAPPSFIAPEVPSAPPSPFSDSTPMSMPEPDLEPEPAGPEFDEAATIMQPMPAFEPPAPVAEWTPPPAPDASWQNQEIGSNTPFQPPPAGVAGQNKTLAIISLVCGILSLICCSWFIPGIAAIVLGFIARSKANNDPQNYAGGGMALAGIITGGISIVLGIIVIVLYLAGAIAGNLGNF